MQSGLADGVGTAGVHSAGIPACALHTLVRVTAVPVRTAGGCGRHFGFAFSVRSNEGVLRTGAKDSSDGGAVLHPAYLGVMARPGGLARVLTFIVDAGQPGATVCIYPTL
jgi:hypothetical protein